jgi:DNA polymerase-4
VIVGGGRRGVVTTCCYIARIAGVRSAMPMFKALKLCPSATVVKPRMEVYAAESRRIRALMEGLTPLVEPLSLDEAFLDLSGTERLFGAAPALSLARLAARIEREIGITVSIGLSHAKFLAKLGSDMDKPRGFTVIGRAETAAFLADLPVGRLSGVGPGLAARLARDGFAVAGQLRAAEPADLVARYGGIGARLHALACGEDDRRVSPDRAPQSISAETTFDEDIADRDRLEGHLWRLAIRVSDRAKAKGLAGRRVTLKLTTAGFRRLTRQTSLDRPTDLADRIWREAAALLDHAAGAAPFRLVGVGIGQLEAARPGADGDLFADDLALQRDRAERASDSIRARFGSGAIYRGRMLR